MIRNTTGFSRVELQLQPKKLEVRGRKLKLHAAEAGGVPSSLSQQGRRKLMDHTAKETV